MHRLRTAFACLLFASFLGSPVCAARIVVGPVDNWEGALISAPAGSTISLLPGRYTGSCGFEIFHDLHIIGEGGAEATVIDCQESARHLHVQGGANVTVEGISFVGGKTEQGGGCVLVDSSELYLLHCRLEHCVSALQGGAIHSVTSALVLRRVEFSRCETMSSGGCVATENGTVSVTESSFLDCHADFDGGAVYIERSELRSNVLRMHNNTASESGGAIAARDESVVRMANSVVEGNAAGMFDDVDAAEAAQLANGGAIALARRSKLHAVNVAFIHNLADHHGGALYAEAGCDMAFDGGEVRANTASFRGGGVTLRFDCTFTASGGFRLADNTAAHFAGFHPNFVGGGMYCRDSVMVLTDGVEVSGNYVGAFGGGIMISLGATGYIFGGEKGVDIRSNTALMLGGGVMLWEDISMATEGAVRIRDNGNVIRDGAIFGGGGMIVRGGSVELGAGLEISDNAVQSFGGGVYLHAAQMTATGPVTVTSNYAFRGGGGIAAMAGSSVRLVAGTELAGNSVDGDGGGVFLEDGGTLQAAGLRLHDNTAGASGGGVYGQGATVELNGTVAEANTAGKDGGAVATQNGAVVWRECVVAGNKAGGNGGGLQASSATAVLWRSHIRGNEAGNEGGGLQCAGGAEVEVAESEVAGCRAGEQGGGLAAVEEARLVLSGMTVQGNKAGRRGGGLVAGGRVCEVAGSRLEGNWAGEQGGGLFWTSQVTVQGEVAVVNNSAGAEGGGLCGSGWGAELGVAAGATLAVEGNEAEDGGGVALLSLARLKAEPLACSERCGAATGDGVCDLECMSAGCGFDGLDCASLFEGAGPAAAAACDRSSCFFYLENTPDLCNAEVCLHAGCDWSGANPACSSALEFARACPLFDALAWHSINQHPGLTYVQGGTAKGVGRCTEQCREGPPPALPAWCSEAECQAAADVASAGWCTTVDDGGKVLERDCEICSTTHELGVSWGTCSPGHPRLPGSAWAYADAEMARILELPVPVLLREFPGCGALPLLVHGNRARHFGGGLFKGGCNTALHRRDECFVEGVEGSMLVVFQDNEAGGAGGGAFVQCHTIGECGATSGLSTSHNLSSMLFFADNRAGTFGSDLATGPQELLLEDPALQYVPGQSELDLSIVVKDSQQQTMRSNPDAVLDFLVSASVCSTDDLQCSKTTSLQPDSFSFIGEGQDRIALKEFGALLRYCEVGNAFVDVKFSIVGDGIQVISSLSKTIRVECLPCEPGQKKKQEFSKGRLLWTCVDCKAGEYIVDPSDHTMECQSCPVGAECLNGRLHPRVEGSLWVPGDGGQFILKSCPPQHSLINSIDGTSTGEFDHDTQQCYRCQANQYVTDPNRFQCQDCPAGAKCDGQNLTGLVPGSVWAGDGEQLRLVECPAGYIVLHSEDGLQDSCVACPPDSYSLVPARKGKQLSATLLEEVTAGKLCLPCEYGTTCEGRDGVVPKKGFWLKPPGWSARRESQAAEDAGAVTAQVFPCPPDACKEGGTCSAGREGPVCGVCAPGYAMGSGKCVECVDGLRSWGVVAWVLVGCVLASAWYLLSVRPLFPSANTGPSSFSRMRAMVEELRLEAARGEVAIGCFKVIVSFYQMLGSFLYTFDVKWDFRHSSLMQYSSISTFNFISLPGPSCMLSDLSHLTKLHIYTFLPLVAAILFALPAAVVMAYDRVFSLPSRSHLLSSVIIRPVLVLMFMVYPMVTYQMLSHFQCQDLGDGLRLLVANYAVPCPRDDKGGPLFLISLVAGIVYSAGIPLAFYLALAAYGVPEMATRKLMDEATAQLIFVYQRFHAHNHATLLGILGLTAHQAEDAGLVRQRCEGVVEEAKRQHGAASLLSVRQHLAEQGAHLPSRAALAASGAREDMAAEELSGLLASTVAARDPGGFTGDEQFQTLTDEQIRHLLLHDWMHAVAVEGKAKGEFERAASSSSSAGMGSVKRLMSWDRQRPFGGLGELSRADLAVELMNLVEELQRKHVVEQHNERVAWDGSLGEQEQRALDHIGFLFKGYTVGEWYWELVEVVRKFIITTLMTFIFPGSHTQLMVAFAILAAFLLFSSRVRPFKDERVEKVHTFASVGLCTTLFYAIGTALVVDGRELGSTTADVFAVISFAFNCIVFIYPFILQFLRSNSSPTMLLRRYWRRKAIKVSKATAVVTTQIRKAGSVTLRRVGSLAVYARAASGSMVRTGTDRGGAGVSRPTTAAEEPAAEPAPQRVGSVAGVNESGREEDAGGPWRRTAQAQDSVLVSGGQPVALAGLEAAGIDVSLASSTLYLAPADLAEDGEDIERGPGENRQRGEGDAVRKDGGIEGLQDMGGLPIIGQAPRLPEALSAELTLQARAYS